MRCTKLDPFFPAYDMVEGLNKAYLVLTCTAHVLFPSQGLCSGPEVRRVTDEWGGTHHKLFI